MPNEIELDYAVEEHLQSLGSLPQAPPLPDPDLLWMRAQLLAREEAELTALRSATLRGAWRYGFVAAGGAWLFAEGVRFDVWLPTVSVATATLVTFGAAVLLGGLVLGRSFVTQRLRDFGLF